MKEIEKQNNPPAFPLIDEIGNFIQTGMTLRDYFANSAMNGICCDPDTWRLTIDGIAEQSYKLADAMLKEREKQ